MNNKPVNVAGMPTPLEATAQPVSTSGAQPVADAGGVAISYPSPFKEFVMNFAKNRGAVIGLAFLLLMILAAILPP